MANINLSQKTYVDYVGSLYFNALGVSDAKFSVKPVEVEGEKVPLIHISGVQKTSGIKVNVDLWPRNHATEEDMKALENGVTDIEFRVGYWPSIDENGEPVLREGTPKWTAFSNGGSMKELSGDKRQFAE